jgi:hypothetical protein
MKLEEQFEFLMECMLQRFKEMRRVDKNLGANKKASAMDYFEWCSEEVMSNVVKYKKAVKKHY